MEKKTIVVGAGPAGLMAAISAAMGGNSVLVAEKNPQPARKLKITGKGRCNVTNNCDREQLLSAVRSNPKFLYSAFSSFTPQDTMDFFEGLGVPLKTERGNRVFPVSDKASDIANALVGYAKDCGVKFIFQPVRSVVSDNGAAVGVKLANGEVLKSDNVIIATGGLSYPLTGSTGDGYRFAQKAGHLIVEPRASLVPLDCLEEWCGTLEGLSLKNVSLSYFVDSKCVYKQLGEMLFTSSGIGGPLVLSASTYYKEGLSNSVLIDLKPGLDEEMLDKRILRDLEEKRNKDFCNALDDLLPRRLIDVVVALSGIEPTTKAHSITKKQRKDLVALLKNLPLSVVGTRDISEAVVTAGGVDVSLVDPKTMESKLMKGLFFAGEVLDVDAVTGGYNLQIAFSTGAAAGKGAAAE
ncbi:MAG: NAD(P)/FAD-dependent oxidoreductase [Clostridia bacterium]|nr:NAD(P)/FAD-dependent oxidoreductase [Clostridia bacterium]